MLVEINNPQDIADTGVVGYVYPYDHDKSICVVIRRGYVDIEGAATFPPEWAEAFAEAIKRAAEVAREYDSQLHEQGG